MCSHFKIFLKVFLFTASNYTVLPLLCIPKCRRILWIQIHVAGLYNLPYDKKKLSLFLFYIFSFFFLFWLLFPSWSVTSAKYEFYKSSFYLTSIGTKWNSIPANFFILWEIGNKKFADVHMNGPFIVVLASVNYLLERVELLNIRW